VRNFTAAPEIALSIFIFFILEVPKTKTYLTQKIIMSKATSKVSPELEKCQNEKQ